MGAGGEAALSRYNEFRRELAFDRCNEGPFFQRIFCQLPQSPTRPRLSHHSHHSTHPPPDEMFHAKASQGLPNSKPQERAAHYSCNGLARGSRHVPSPKGFYAGISTKLLMRCQARNDAVVGTYFDRAIWSPEMDAQRVI